MEGSRLPETVASAVALGGCCFVREHCDMKVGSIRLTASLHVTVGVYASTLGVVYCQALMTLKAGGLRD